MPKPIIYLDHSATTPVDPQVLKTMLPYFTNKFGNASSIHAVGTEAAIAVEKARQTVAEFLACRPEELFFTSGATESDNWAILGLVQQLTAVNFKPHLIVSAIEHEAVLEPARHLAKLGLADISYLKVNARGLAESAELKRLIKPNTVLVSVMLANNEIGTIQPIKQLSQVIAAANKNRQNKIYFHSDATQAPAYLDCDVNQLGVDLLSLSAHKIYGPKGIGALFVRKGVPLAPLFYGGGQQQGRRSGTYNVSGIVGFGRAVELINGKKSRAAEIKRLSGLRDYLFKQIKKKIPRASITGDLTKRLPSHASFVFAGVEGESMLLFLSQQGIMVSTGSACSSGSLDPSHVLLAIGLKPEVAHGSLRVTLGRATTKKDLDQLIKILPPIIKKLRAMSPLK